MIRKSITENEEEMIVHSAQPKDAKGKKSTAPAGRPRSIRAHHAVLQAALDLLKERGYKAVTIEGIADRAGVGRQTIYRWWPSKAAIVLEAAAAMAEVQVQVQERGSLRHDLQIFLERTFRALEQTGPIMRGLMAEAQLDPAFGAALRTGFIEQRRRVLRGILRRGIARGELKQEIDCEFLIDVLYGSMWYRLLNQHAPLNKRFASQLAALVTQ